ncbi:ankyrin repeat domain-containing protein [Paludisphaera mucosa]|uniref:Ankyrin repeat domain-containing protein n=1 Tax=Paludisphaera mucosa TaxID=3030827 RepID=A0ABT6FBN8_9BACT|nr:ankyrin repeat domain-containing protein [Paludisphaera mucosa]MDG3004964.1 ankyrin repeat domain-containing protein [Paludisphaera mucosa]
MRTPTTAAVRRSVARSAGESDRRTLEMILAAGGRLGLREAVILGDVDLARRILDADPTIDVSGDAHWYHSYPFLMVAAEFGRPEMARFLLDRGAAIEATDEDVGFTALGVAACVGCLEVAALLLDRGAEIDHVDVHGFTPLAHAAERRKLDVVRLLIARGARRGILDAVLLGDAARVAALLAEVDGPEGRDLYVVQACRELAVAAGDLEILALLLDSDPPSPWDDYGCPTFLGSAAESGGLDVVELLVSRGYDPNQPDRDGLTPLARAERAGHSEVADYLRRLA